ncbi:hypothetical protein [Flavobacterium terrisoli]|uniref:hypothetical protein n=1 Tax=Flavobacterium terrisoli TaxID=3242195 RepID=UPI0025434787|nr:hypothetical protein [Flavobacterium buctense]
MKKSVFLLLVFPLLLIGCKKVDNVEILGKPVTVEPTPKGNEECYSYEKDGNSISIQIETSGEDVFGAMAYSLAEKDKSAGLLKGKWKNNILLLDYTFQSEGTQSKRQVAFELKDGQLIEGFGEMNEDGTEFKDISQLKFSPTMPLSKTDCPK